MTKYLIILLSLTFFQTSLAQLNLPEPSPGAYLKQKVGFTTISINYSRPSAKGRTIFGGLVPYQEIWRTGASDATTIKFSDNVTINEKSIAKGNYSLYTIPTKTTWTIIINTDTTLHGTSGYNDSLDVLRFVVPSITTEKFYETFTISILDIINGQADLVINWEKTEVRFKIDSQSDQKVLLEIQKRIETNKEKSPGLYFQSAMYYFETSKDLKTAENYIKRAIEIEEDPKYFILQSKIYKKQGRKNEAIESGKRALKLSKEKKAKHYIKMCEDLLEDLK